MYNEREKWDNGRWAYVRLTVSQTCDMLCWHSACEIHARAHTHITIRMSIIECSRCASCQFCSNNEFYIHCFCFLFKIFIRRHTNDIFEKLASSMHNCLFKRIASHGQWEWFFFSCLTRHNRSYMCIWCTLTIYECTQAHYTTLLKP